MSFQEFRLDMHVHTCLSPCGDARMIPGALVQRAIEQELDAVWVTDHNSAENVGAVIAAAKGTSLTVLPGMEVTSSEEAHLLGLFESVEEALELQGRVYSRLPGENNPDAFGHQWIVDSEGYVDGECDRLLIGATGFDFGDAVALIKSIGGIAVAAHVDRVAFSVVGQLGFIPPEADIDAVELLKPIADRRYDGFPVIQSSDAHFLDAIGARVTTIYAKAPSLSELRLALRNERGREVRS